MCVVELFDKPDARVVFAGQITDAVPLKLKRIHEGAVAEMATALTCHAVYAFWTTVLKVVVVDLLVKALQYVAREVVTEVL